MGLFSLYRVRVRNQKIDMSNPTGFDSTTRYTAFLALHLPSHSLHSIPTMSVVWTKEMAEEFLAKSSPDPLFPCQTEAQLIHKCEFALSIPWKQGPSTWNGNPDGLSGSVWKGDANTWHQSRQSGTDTYWSDFWEKTVCGGHTTTIANERDEFGRCNANTKDRACANCNCRMLFNQLECVKADLETTKVALEECKKERTDEKRRFSIAIAKMVQSEMRDVRTQLSALNLCLKEELGEKALEKKAASEAAKAALSASKFITLRLLMF